jgi:hypothetical protein
MIIDVTADATVLRLRWLMRMSGTPAGFRVMTGERMGIIPDLNLNHPVV